MRISYFLWRHAYLRRLRPKKGDDVTSVPRDRFCYPVKLCFQRSVLLRVCASKMSFENNNDSTLAAAEINAPVHNVAQVVANPSVIMLPFRNAVSGQAKFQQLMATTTGGLEFRPFALCFKAVFIDESLAPRQTDPLKFLNDFDQYEALVARINPPLTVPEVEQKDYLKLVLEDKYTTYMNWMYCIGATNIPLPVTKQECLTACLSYMWCTPGCCVLACNLGLCVNYHEQWRFWPIFPRKCQEV